MKSTTRFLFHTLAALCAAAILGGCATGGPGGSGARQPQRQAESLALSGQHEAAARIYDRLAAEAVGPDRDRFTLLAVEQWLNAGEGRRARSLFRDLPQPAAGDLLWLWTTNSAALHLWDGRPDDALNLLQPLSRQALPRRHRVTAEALRADAWFQKGDPTRAVNLYMQRENWLDDRQSIENNRRRLWLGLLVSDAEALRDAADASTDPVVKGWLTLGSLAAATGRQGVGWSNGVVRWQEQHIGHPAEVIVSNLDLPQGGLLDYPRQIALLLPLSGGQKAAGNAIQNGFFGAYFGAAAGLDEQQQLRVYDVNEAGGAKEAYARAMQDGAEFVVGPLLSRNVADLANEVIFPIPVLALNNLRAEQIVAPGFYQFGLAPEQEAAAAARRALADGHKYALALYPDDDWGTRVVNAFTEAFEAAGGRLLDHQRYTPSDQDFSVEIRNLLAISRSQQRHRRLEANLGTEIDFEPRRRKDADLIFLAANGKSGRLLNSQLKFHEAGDVQVYSTSFIYSMDGRSDRDLNGVMFADAPWIILPPPWLAALPQVFQEYFPAERRLGRLHALGYDAYQLVAPLYVGRTAILEEIDGATGRLTLQQSGQVYRQPSWAQFERGEPVAVPDAREFAPLDEAAENVADGPSERWSGAQQ
ncbi:MAG: penicillin-binding protein activator [Gammaproteobacteria bacterium]|nr:penicillin-binding protein activator [Gammaproteobacteria bacterium]